MRQTQYRRNGEGEAVTPKCLNGPPVDRDRRKAHPGCSAMDSTFGLLIQRSWGYVKSLVYADKPQTLDHLKDNIRRVIADIRPQMLEKVIENWTSRLDYIRASRGSPMPEIIFKM
ncbi:hypothetical protein TNCV_2363941 [Trichonephila clavipes]|nr:hypothetical protein TNCV_2363941 [Trichonephila clavipes]